MLLEPARQAVRLDERVELRCLLRLLKQFDAVFVPSLSDSRIVDG